jgi:hypothetical protein
MRVTAAGNVGIGTSPSYKLDVDAGAPSSADKVISRHMSETSRQLGLVWDDSASTLGLATLTNHSLSFHTNGINPRMVIDNAGRVTKPLQPSFRAYKNSITSTSGSNVFWTGTFHNTGGHFNVSNGRFTVPITGVYQINLHWLSSSSTSQGDVHILINGAANAGARTRNSSSGAHETTTVCHSMYLQINDYVEVNYTGTSDFYGDSSSTWSGISGYLLG